MQPSYRPAFELAKLLLFEMNLNKMRLVGMMMPLVSQASLKALIQIWSFGNI